MLHNKIKIARFIFMLRAYKYELKLTAQQKEFFNKSFGCARVVYNYCLERRVKLYESDKQGISAVDLCKEIVKLKKDENYKWLAEVDHQTLSCAVRNLDSAFTKFFREKKGFPNFKKKHGKLSASFTQGVKIDFENNLVRFPKILWCKAKISRKFEGQIKTVTVSKIPCGKYFVSILVDNSIPLPQKAVISEQTSVGIDVGIKTFATLSDGTKIENQKHLENTQKRLSALQRRLARRVKGSKRREKAKLAVAKCHYKITCQRNDFLHKASSNIVKNHDNIIIEDLNIEGMLKNHCLARSVSSVAWGEFFRQLQYKCDWYGKNLITIGRFEPSSKLCTCGTINKELTLKDRTWTCESCGTTHDRDLLAAQNIKRFGLEKQNLIGVGNSVKNGNLSAVS